MIAQDKQLRDLLSALEKLSLGSKSQKVAAFLAQKMQSTQHEDALLIEKISGQSLLSPKELAEVILSSLKQVKSLSILLALYGLWEKCRRTVNTGVDWRGEYELKRKQRLLEGFNQWVFGACKVDPEVCNQVLARVLTGLAALLENEKIRSSEVQFDSCLQWLSVFRIKGRDDHLCGLRAARLVKEVSDIRVSDFEKKEHLILRKIMELLGSQERRNGSLYLFFDRFTIRSEDIEYFINIKEDFFEDLDEEQLCNVFAALLQPGLNRQILQLFHKVSSLLRSNEQYYILRTLYEQVVLPIAASRYKTHAKLAPQLFAFVLFYVAGFLYHCSLGSEGIDCLLDNLGEVKDKELQRKWGELALVCCKEEPVLKGRTLKQLQGLGVSGVTNGVAGVISGQKMVWTVTMHNGRKLKKYPEIESYKFKGIENRNNQCYIISVVQALFTTQELRHLASDLRTQAKQNKLRLLDELRYIFEDDLSVQTKTRPTVQYLKNLGPEEFKLSNQQQDAQEYLVKLFECLENELRQVKQGLPAFHEIFRAEFRTKIYCPECKSERELKEPELTYVNSYGAKEDFEFTREQPLDENYKCGKCGCKKSVKLSRLASRPRVLILHINRFRHKEGQARKILGNRPIKRSIGEYRLVGFIAHKGTHIHAGHYLYYYRVDGGRWALFNDSRVTEFNVGDDQEFEREFRAENTPYILFYRLKAVLQR